jgi:hypothetical protein
VNVECLDVSAATWSSIRQQSSRAAYLLKDLCKSAGLDWRTP